MNCAVRDGVISRSGTGGADAGVFQAIAANCHRIDRSRVWAITRGARGYTSKLASGGAATIYCQCRRARPEGNKSIGRTGGEIGWGRQGYPSSPPHCSRGRFQTFRQSNGSYVGYMLYSWATASETFSRVASMSLSFPCSTSVSPFSAHVLPSAPSTPELSFARLVISTSGRKKHAPIS